ncbi:MAG: PA0069 family radical SAM protein [Pseudomonadota bacterium]
MVNGHSNAVGRGTPARPKGRFEALDREHIDDGWEEQRGSVARTEVRIERPRNVISRNTSPDLSFDRSINPYRGCEHGCIYCFARPSHSFLNYSPGLDFETKLIARPGAAELLARELSASKYQPKVIAIGTNTDAYQPIERRYRIMRGILEVLDAFNHTVGITTKGVLIEEDIDLLARMAERGLVRVGVSVTTLDSVLSRKMEPRVPAPDRRLATITRLAEAGIPVRVLVSPIIPGLTDHELESILSAARDAGATGASWAMLRLPFEVSRLFRDWLAEHYPNQAIKVMSRVRLAHGGKDYDAAWHKRLRGEGVYADMIARRFRLTTKRLGLDRDMPELRADLFAVPPRPGDQLELF